MIIFRFWKSLLASINKFLSLIIKTTLPGNRNTRKNKCNPLYIYFMWSKLFLKLIKPFEHATSLGHILLQPKLQLINFLMYGINLTHVMSWNIPLAKISLGRKWTKLYDMCALMNYQSKFNFFTLFTTTTFEFNYFMCQCFSTGLWKSRGMKSSFRRPKKNEGAIPFVENLNSDSIHS